MLASFTPPDRLESHSLETLQAAINALEDPIFVKDLLHRWVACNQAFCDLLGHPYEAVIGKSDPDLWPADQAAIFWQGDDEVFTSGKRCINEELITGSDGVTHTIWTRKYPIHDSEGKICGLVGIITQVKQQHEQVSQLEAAIQRQLQTIQTQNALLDALAVPVVQIWDRTLLLPLIGAVDSRRAQMVLENLLTAIEEHRAQYLILDVTGVPVVDTAVAGTLLRSVEAAKLLGCECVLVGISPEIAQTIVGLGLDFSRLVIRATLQQGLEYVIAQHSPIAASPAA